MLIMRYKTFATREKRIKRIEEEPSFPEQSRSKVGHDPAKVLLLIRKIWFLSSCGSHRQRVRAPRMLQIFLKLLRDIFEQDYTVFLKTLEESILAFNQLENQGNGLEYFETFIRYIMNARNDLEFQTVYELAKEISLERSEVVMTIAEKLITEGMEKGIEKGMEKGMEKGKLEVAENLLRLGMGIDMIIKATGLTEEEIRKIMN